jgi:hypothetical protein
MCSQVLSTTTDESLPAWPQPVRAVPGSPNVRWVWLDDTGFGQLGRYGSPIAIPNFDVLAAAGLRYTNMHPTAPCSPSAAMGALKVAVGQAVITIHRGGRWIRDRRGATVR